MATLTTGAVLGSATLPRRCHHARTFPSRRVGNYVHPLPGGGAPGRTPYGGVRRARPGGGAARHGLSPRPRAAAPFVFLPGCPASRSPWLWLASLPLALVGAVAVYAMLVAGAARLFRRREPDLLERVLEAEAEA
jgi:hypothetical protein